MNKKRLPLGAECLIVKWQSWTDSWRVDDLESVIIEFNLEWSVFIKQIKFFTDIEADIVERLFFRNSASFVGEKRADIFTRFATEIPGK